jgi:hypothetical protein
VWVRLFGKFIIVLAVTVGLSFGVYYVITSFFRLRKIEYVGEGAIIQIDETRIPGNVLFFPSERIRKTLLSDHPELKDVYVSKKFPNTLRIEPIFREPFILLQTKDKLVLLDKEQVVVTYASGVERYPRVTLPLLVEKKGQRLDDKRITLAIGFILSTAPIVHFTEVTEVDSQSLSFKSDVTEVFITQNADLAEVTTTLQTLIEGFRIKGILPRIIDLRFSKPIIKN